LVAQLRETPLLSHERTRAAIVRAALVVLAEDGAAARLDDVAVAAGISRATLYRHFPSREELFAALVDEAYADVIARIHDAQTNDVPFPEALARVARATATTGTQFIALCSEPLCAQPHQLDDEYEQLMEELFERGKREGSIRTALSNAWLSEAWRSLTVAALRYGSSQRLGPEPIATLLVGQFLAGAAAV
jgi:TetR/AcrR family transcriptional regulator, mexCD-oprJ operon repressor